MGRSSKKQFQKTHQNKKSQNPCTSQKQNGAKLNKQEQQPHDNQITEIPNELNIIRNKAQITKVCNTEPTVIAWLTKDYKGKKVKKVITNLKTNKAHVSDGTP